MRISELKAREDFLGILVQTLEQSWSVALGRPVRVTAAPASGQLWVVNPVLSAIHTRGVSRRARSFMADAFRYTPVQWRIAFQFALGTTAASTLGSRLLSRPLFTVAPEVPGATDLVIVPGNQRVRVFDFQRGVTRVLLKAGFDCASLTREVELRENASRETLFVPITGSDVAAGWFEEPIIDGWTLPRCPPWKDRTGYGRTALLLLRNWLEMSARDIDAGEYASGLLERLADASERAPLTEQSVVRESLLRLAATAGGMGRVAVAVGHGDFQPGNIMVEKRHGRVRLIDWEYSGVRSIHYDGLVYGLCARTTNWVDMLLQYVESGSLGHADLLLGGGRDSGWRRSVAALFVLEELVWQLDARRRMPSNARAHGAMALSPERLRRLASATGRGRVFGS